MKRNFTLTLLLLFVALIFAAPLSAQDPWVYRDNPRWDRSWNNRPLPQRGACFFTDRNFRGNRFCVRAGDRLSSLPGGFGDNISSIQLFNAGVRVFDNRNFGGHSAEIRRSMADLRNRRLGGGHTWNNRISSIAVQ